MVSKFLVHAEAGHGKSTLLQTMPGPRLIVDTENKSQWLTGEVFKWDDLSMPLPKLTVDSTVIISVQDLQSFGDCVSVLQRDLPFRSYGVDSFSMLQEKLLQDYDKGQAPGRDSWGFLKVKCELILNTLLKKTNADAIVLVAWTTVRDDAYRPLLDGAMRDKLPHYVDVVGRVILEMTPAGVTQKMLIWPQSAEGETLKTFCKDNTGRLLKAYGPVIHGPDISDIVNTMREV